MVLHGGSGQADEDFVEAVKSGMAVVHINTEIRKAWRAGIEAGLAQDPNEVTPSKILTPAQVKMAELIEGRLKLFARIP
jgi:fructose-bisphosphate aldolase class II